MYKIISLILLLFSCVVDLMSKDAVLLTIDGEDVYLSEFVYSYKRADALKHCSVDDYFHYFLRCKMKVADARRRGLSADGSFVSRVNALKNIVVSEKRSDTFGSFCLEVVKLEVYTYRLPQRKSRDRVNVSKAVMNDIYHKVLSGMTFDEIVLQNNDSNLLCENYNDRWIERDFLLDELNSEIERLRVGENSSVIYSPEGMHVIVLRGKGSYRNVGVDACEGMFVKQLEESLLLKEWDRNVSLPYMNFTESDLKMSFKHNKKSYRWEYPHYRGMVIHCNSKKLISKLRKKLKRQPLHKWSEIVREYCKDKNEKAVFDIGLFMIGSNRYVDKLVFKCGDFEKDDDYRYISVIGKLLDYEPDDYMDVYDEVKKDYLSKAEDKFFCDLERILMVEKHLDVLKTVNCSASN